MEIKKKTSTLLITCFIIFITECGNNHHNSVNVPNPNFLASRFLHITSNIFSLSSVLPLLSNQHSSIDGYKPSPLIIKKSQ